MTIANFHTAHELSDLLDAKNANINDLAAAFAGASSSVDLTDPTWAAWVNDWSAFHTRWGVLSAKASAAVAADKDSLLGWDGTTEESLYASVLAILPPFDDLVRRWPTLPQNPNPQYESSPTPQPTAPDSDLNFVNETKPLANFVDDLFNAAKAPFTHPKTSLLVVGAAIVLTVGVAAALRKAIS